MTTPMNNYEQHSRRIFLSEGRLGVWVVLLFSTHLGTSCQKAVIGHYVLCNM